MLNLLALLFCLSQKFDLHYAADLFDFKKIIRTFFKIKKWFIFLFFIAQQVNKVRGGTCWMYVVIIIEFISLISLILKGLG
jgi:hypothetical protein